VSSSTEAVLSPCMALCKLNPQQVCIGCKRTLDEISQWRHMSQEQKTQIMQQLASRTLD